MRAENSRRTMENEIVRNGDGVLRQGRAAGNSSRNASAMRLNGIRTRTSLHYVCCRTDAPATST